MTELAVHAHHNEEYHRELMLMAVAASDDLKQAQDYLYEEHKLLSGPTVLADAVKKYPEQYEELRQKVLPLREQTLAHNLLDNALYASKVMMVVLKQLEQRLGEDRVEPQHLSRVARDLGDVFAKSTDKKLALEGRPARIVENRNAPEIIRALEAKGVLRRVEIEATAEDDNGGATSHAA